MALLDISRSAADFFAKTVPDFSGSCRGDFAKQPWPLAGTPGKIRKNPTIAAGSQTRPSFVRGERRFNPIALAFETGQGRRTSSPCVRAGGKDTFGKSQPIVIYDVKLKKYFANRAAKLAKWQTTPFPGTWSLHRCNRCMQCGATTCNAVQRPALHCNDLQCNALHCNAV